MNADSAKLMVVFGVGTAVVGTSMKEIIAGKRGPSFYVPLAGAIMAVPLLVLSDFNPQIAGSLALLIFVAAVVYSGTAIMEVAQNAGGSGGASNPNSRTLQTPTSRTGP